jgi:hypothetical protein
MRLLGKVISSLFLTGIWRVGIQYCENITDLFGKMNYMKNETCVSSRQSLHASVCWFELDKQMAVLIVFFRFCGKDVRSRNARI